MSVVSLDQKKRACELLDRAMHGDRRNGEALAVIGLGPHTPSKNHLRSIRIPFGPEDGRIVAYDPPDPGPASSFVRYAHHRIERNGGTLVDIGRGHFALKD
jgi:hypothetical protein